MAIPLEPILIRFFCQPGIIGWNLMDLNFPWILGKLSEAPTCKIILSIGFYCGKATVGRNGSRLALIRLIQNWKRPQARSWKQIVLIARVIRICTLKGHIIFCKEFFPSFSFSARLPIQPFPWFPNVWCLSRCTVHISWKSCCASANARLCLDHWEGSEGNSWGRHQCCPESLADKLKCWRTQASSSSYHTIPESMYYRHW